MNNSVYYEKYLKYKLKYLNLKQSAGGDQWKTILNTTFSDNGYQLEEEVIDEVKKIYNYKINEKKVFNLNISEIEDTITLNIENESSISSEDLVKIFYKSFKKREFIVSEKIRLKILVIKTTEKDSTNFLEEKGFIYNDKTRVWTFDTNKKPQA